MFQNELPFFYINSTSNTLKTQSNNLVYLNKNKTFYSQNVQKNKQMGKYLFLGPFSPVVVCTSHGPKVFITFPDGDCLSASLFTTLTQGCPRR